MLAGGRGLPTPRLPPRRRRCARTARGAPLPGEPFAVAPPKLWTGASGLVAVGTYPRRSRPARFRAPPSRAARTLYSAGTLNISSRDAQLLDSRSRASWQLVQRVCACPWAIAVMSSISDPPSPPFTSLDRTGYGGCPNAASGHLSPGHWQAGEGRPRRCAVRACVLGSSMGGAVVRLGHAVACNRLWSQTAGACYCRPLREHGVPVRTRSPMELCGLAPVASPHLARLTCYPLPPPAPR